MVIEESANLPAKELMNPNVVSVGPDATLKEVSELMGKQKIGSVVVVDNDKAVGIVTERDFATKIMTKPYLPDTKVSVVMSSPVIHVAPNQSVAEIIDTVLSRLESPFPEILQLRLQGRTEHEIAAELGCGREAVRYRLRRICDELRHLLSEGG